MMDLVKLGDHMKSSNVPGSDEFDLALRGLRISGSGFTEQGVTFYTIQA